MVWGHRDSREVCRSTHSPQSNRGGGGGEQRDGAEAELCEFGSCMQLRWLKCISMFCYII
jgi:hypothetical protein